MANPKNSKTTVIKKDTYYRLCLKKTVISYDSGPLPIMTPIDTVINRLANDSAILAELKKHVVPTGKTIPSAAKLYYFSQTYCLTCLNEQDARRDLVRSMEMCEISDLTLEYVSVSSDGCNIPEVCRSAKITRTPATVLIVDNEIVGQGGSVLEMVEKWKAIRVCVELLSGRV